MALVRSLSAVQLSALARAVAELDEVAFGQAQGRDVAVVGGIHDARGARAEIEIIDQAAQVFDRGRHVERVVLDGRHDQVARGVQRGPRDRLVARRMTIL